MNAVVALLVLLAVIWLIVVLTTGLPLWLLFLCLVVIVVFFL